MMKFLDKLNEQWSMLDEADAPAPALAQPSAPVADLNMPQDATAPDPNAAAPGEGEPAEIAPEGYAGLVRILAKALAMSFPPEALDEIFQTKIEDENAIPMLTAIEAVIKQNEMYGDNPERLDNPHLKSYINSITPGNFIKKYKQLLTVMKKRDPSIKNDQL